MKYNVVISIEDDYSCIYVWNVFNNEINPLFFNSLNNESSILNGNIYNRVKFQEVINNLLTSANKFLKFEISEVDLCLHNFNVNIHNFELSIDLKNKLINKVIWENDILPNLQIKKVSSDQFVYDFDVTKWKIGEKIIEKFDKEYSGDSITIIGKKYIINKLIYNAYEEILNALKVKINNFSTTVDLYKNSFTKNELNVLIGKNNLSMASINNGHLISNVVCEDKGLNMLINKMIKEFNIGIEDLKSYINNINFFKKNIDIEIIDKLNKKTASVEKITQVNFDEYINEYATQILDLILEKIEYYKKEKNTHIDTINLISNIPIIQQIYNLFLIHSKHRFNIIKLKQVNMYEPRYMYCVMNANNKLNEYKERVIN